MLDHLEAAGLVQRDRSSSSTSASCSSRSPSAAASSFASAAKTFERRWQEALSGFNDEELRTAAAVLERLGELFDSFDGND